MARMPTANPDKTDTQAQNTTGKDNDSAPSMHQVIAHSPHVVALYKNVMAALPTMLDGLMRERIALLCAEFHRCPYCVSLHVNNARLLDMKDDEIRAARRGKSNDPRVASALQFVRVVLDKRGHTLDDDLTAMRDADYSEGEILEIVAIVAQQTFINYLALTAGLPQEHGYVEFLKGDNLVDEMSEQSFPASDAPSHN
jgi:AhpD family alkylhydroperoxidase